MIDYLGQLDDDDLVMFVIEHLKDHKPAPKLVEGLEPVSSDIVFLWNVCLTLPFLTKGFGRGSRRICSRNLASISLRKSRIQ